MLLVIYMTFHLKINFLMLPVTYMSCRLVIILFHFIFKLKGMPITVQSVLEAVKGLLHYFSTCIEITGNKLVLFYLQECRKLQGKIPKG